MIPALHMGQLHGYEQWLVAAVACTAVVIGPSSVLKMATSGNIVSHTISAVTWMLGLGGTRGSGPASVDGGESAFGAGGGR